MKPKILKLPVERGDHPFFIYTVEAERENMDTPLPVSSIIEHCHGLTCTECPLTFPHPTMPGERVSLCTDSRHYPHRSHTFHMSKRQVAALLPTEEIKSPSLTTPTFLPDFLTDPNDYSDPCSHFSVCLSPYKRSEVNDLCSVCPFQEWDEDDMTQEEAIMELSQYDFPEVTE